MDRVAKRPCKGSNRLKRPLTMWVSVFCSMAWFLVCLLKPSIAAQHAGLPRITLLTGDTFDPSPWRSQLNVGLVKFSKTNISLIDVLEAAEKAVGRERGEMPAQIVIGSGNDPIDGFIAEIAEQFTVPFISISQRRYDYYNKKTFQIRLMPSAIDRNHVILHLAQELGCEHIAVFTSRQKTPTLWVDLRSKLQQHASIGFRLVRLPFNETPLVIVKMTDEIYHMSKYSAVLVVLDMTDQQTSLLIEAAGLISYSDANFQWMVVREDIDLTGAAENLPVGVLGIRSAAFSAKRALGDVFKALNYSLQHAQRKPKERNPGGTASWEDQQRELYRNILMRKFNGETGWIEFDEHGDRIMATYDIVRTTSVAGNSGGEKVWTVVGSAQGSRVNLYHSFWMDTEENHSSVVLRVVVVEEEPMLIVNRECVSKDSECILSYPCTRYVNPLPNGSEASNRSVRQCCCTGFLIDVLRWLENDLHVAVHMYLVKDGTFGAFDETTKRWNGMIADLLANHADVALSTLTTTSDRAKFVDFSYPFLYGQTKIMISSKSTVSLPHVWEFSFLAPFDSFLWVAALVSINLVLLIVWALERQSPFGHYHIRRSPYPRNLFNIGVCMSYIWGNAFKLELEGLKPRSFSARLTTAVFSFFTLIIITSYTANLAASLFSVEDHLPVTGINDPKYPPPGFTFTTLRSSGTLTIFTGSDDPAYRRIGKNMLPYVVKNYTEGIEKLRTGELDAFIYDSPFLELGVSKMPGCSFRVVGHPIATKAYAMAFPPNSPWKDPISHLLLKYERKDYFRKLKQKWFIGGCLYAKRPTEGAHRMQAGNFSDLFLIYFGVIVTCFLLLLPEHLWHYRVKKTGSYATNGVMT